MINKLNNNKDSPWLKKIPAKEEHKSELEGTSSKVKAVEEKELKVTEEIK